MRVTKPKNTYAPTTARYALVEAMDDRGMFRKHSGKVLKNALLEDAQIIHQWATNGAHCSQQDTFSRELRWREPHSDESDTVAMWLDDRHWCVRVKAGKVWLEWRGE